MRCSCNQRDGKVIDKNDKLEYGTKSWLPCRGGPSNITDIGKETILYVADACPRTNSDGAGPESCYSVSDLDASVEGYRSLTGGEYGDRLQATYTFVECPEAYVSGKTIIRFNNQATPWNVEVLPMNHRWQITKILVTYGSSSKKYELAFDNG